MSLKLNIPEYGVTQFNRELKDLIEEYNEENGVTSPSQAHDKKFSNLSTDKYYTTEREAVVENTTNNRYKVVVKDGDNNSSKSDRKDTQDWMVRMRNIEGGRKR